LIVATLSPNPPAMDAASMIPKRESAPSMMTAHTN